MRFQTRYEFEHRPALSLTPTVAQEHPRARERPAVGPSGARNRSRQGVRQLRAVPPENVG